MKKIMALLPFFYIFFICKCSSENTQGISSKNFISLQNYLTRLPELVQSDNHDWEDPSYLQFYKSIKSGWLDKVLRLFRIKEEDFWDPSRIENILQKVVNSQRSFLEGGSYAIHITAKPDTKFIIWGDLFGAAHSLVRDLEYLYEQKIIDNEFRIRKPNYYFVFLGNVINRSPYSLEILQTVLSLMDQNPEKVFYLKGSQETDDYWKNFNLKKELSFFFPFYATRYENLISNLFSSLPEALYITQKDSTFNAIILSNNAKSYSVPGVNRDKFFSEEPDSTTYLPSSMQTKEAPAVEPLAVIKGGKDIKTLPSAHGLTLVEPEQGATAWTVISCPTQIYQEFADFYEDAFVVLTIHSTLKEATLQLFYQDVRNKTGFLAEEPFNASTGQILGQSKTHAKSTYLIGSTLALTKSLSYSGKHIKIALSDLINQSNQKNYLQGHFVKATILDDEYMPSLARRNVEILLNKYKIDTLILPVGSPTLLSYLDLVKAGKVTVLFPVTGSPDFRSPTLKHIIHWRASYQEEARALMEYMITENAAKKFAFFYQNDSYGLGPLATAHQILKEKGITDWVDIPYNKVGTNFEKAAQDLRNAQADAIGFFAIANVAEELIRVMGVESIFNKKLFGISFLAENTLRRFLKEHGIFMLFSAIAPNPRTNNLEIVKDFRALMDVNNDPYDIFALEGYIATNLYLEALKSIKDDITPEKIIKYFESYKNFDFKGLNMTFNPADRSLTQSVWLELSDETWKEVKPQAPSVSVQANTAST